MSNYFCYLLRWAEAKHSLAGVKSINKEYSYSSYISSRISCSSATDVSYLSSVVDYWNSSRTYSTLFFIVSWIEAMILLELRVNRILLIICTGSWISRPEHQSLIARHLDKRWRAQFLLNIIS